MLISEVVPTKWEDLSGLHHMCLPVSSVVFSAPFHRPILSDVKFEGLYAVAYVTVNISLMMTGE